MIGLLSGSNNIEEGEVCDWFGERWVMGCCESTFLPETNPEKEQNQHNQNPTLSHPPPTPGETEADGGGVLSFSEFSLADLKAATNNFSSDHIVSESGDKAPNLVYKGRLQNRWWIAVKKFTKMAWPDPKQFAVESQILPSSSSLFLLLCSFFYCVVELMGGFVVMDNVA